MNERIEEIAHEQGIPWDNKYHWYVSNTDLKRFAELIVRECICQCDDENSQKYIMSHFGFTEKDWS
jgi:hypothetical protein